MTSASDTDAVKVNRSSAV